VQIVQLVSKISNLIHQRHRPTDRRTTCNLNTALCTIVHRAVKIAEEVLSVVWNSAVSRTKTGITHLRDNDKLASIMRRLSIQLRSAMRVPDWGGVTQSRASINTSYCSSSSSRARSQAWRPWLTCTQFLSVIAVLADSQADEWRTPVECWRRTHFYYA